MRVAVPGSSTPGTSAPRTVRGVRPSGLTPAQSSGTVAVLGLAGCSKAGRAVIGAPGCPDGGSGRPEPMRPQTGAVWAYGPHFDPPAGARAKGAVPGWSDVVSVADSGCTTVAVKADGTVWAYGTDIKGSLGQGVHERVYEGEPRRVAGISDARSVHVGGETFFVVRRDGTVTAWGSQNILVNAGKREGHKGVPTPRTVPGAEDVVSMGPGSLTTFALRSDGRVLGWGINLTDVLGDEDGTGLMEVDGVEGVVDVASAGGEDLAFALDEDGAVWAWGRGASGVLGDGDTSEHSSAKPVRVRGLPTVRSIAAFQYTGLAVDTDGGLWGWGSGLVLGDHGKGRADGTPVRITAPGPVLEVSGRHVIVEAASEETGDGAGAADRG
ncbi:RCC1 domain-containing protein [Streptomyces sp. NPDC058442]|uniref:RCC1 domain-containing protein n=1 Tax=Streptomyces sp. NPDC058442 TaxID=3346503 RepID=UPI0036537771